MCVGGEAQVHVFCLKGDHVSFKLLKGGENKSLIFHCFALGI